MASTRPSRASTNKDAQLLVSGDPAEALRIEPLLASGVAEHADFVASFEHYREALGEHGAKATLQAVLDATAG